LQVIDFPLKAGYADRVIVKTTWQFPFVLVISIFHVSDLVSKITVESTQLYIKCCIFWAITMVSGLLLWNR